MLSITLVATEVPDWSVVKVSVILLFAPITNGAMGWMGSFEAFHNKSSLENST